MSSSDWLAVITFALVLPVMAFLAVKQWRDEVRLHSDPLMLLGPRVWRAVSRGLPLLGLGLLAAVLLVLPALIVPGHDDPAWTRALVYVAGAVFAVSYLAVVAVALCNRPSFLVPPARRGERGLLAERRDPAGSEVAAEPRRDFARAEAPVADRAPDEPVSTYCDPRLAGPQAAFFGVVAAYGFAASVTWIGQDWAGIAVGALFAGTMLHAMYACW